MPPSKPLPISDEFSSADNYVSSLLDFASTNDLFQILCGGVHILDFFTDEPGLFQWVLEPGWQKFLMECDPMVLLDFLLRDDPDATETGRSWPEAPESLRQYVKAVRRLSLRRSFTPVKPRLPVIPRQVAVGMNVKKKHEVTNFADYVDRLAADIARLTGTEMTHFIDFGSGQNYLGRTLASAPYSKDIVAVERHEHNQAGARELDVLAGIAETEKVLRNKKIWQSLVDSKKDAEDLDEKARRRKAEQHTAEQIAAAELRPRKELEAIYRPEEGRGLIKYVTGRLETGDLSEVLNKIHDADIPEEKRKELSLMAISIHSCGNLSHFGIRSMILNPSIKAVAIVGSCQAPQNWTEVESDSFFTRHFYRAVLQKIFLDKGVITKVYHGKTDSGGDGGHGGNEKESPFNMSTNPVIIGSLGKSCFKSFHAYVRGAIKKLASNEDTNEKYSAVIHEKMGDMTDEEIDAYARAYAPRKRELSSIWTLMAFSAGVVESLIVTDRWLFLKEHGDVVQDCWVESVFDYKESPRNLVVVGIKKNEAAEGG
ncbi:hypothetical protein LA080_006915 [Diaporthe eres]|nr:hypothetical protein LA080_006915 [Diaporthe eres]